MKSILDGIYAYGRKNWRYGYGLKEEGYDDRYTFALSANQSVRYTIAEEEYRPGCGSSCKCYWDSLVASDSPCNFADCFIFTNVLENVAGVMGIGGLRYLTITGAGGVGFVTQPGASLDPRFTGSVLCSNTYEPCYPYYFYSHSLRTRNGFYYDPTYGKTYYESDGPIALSHSNDSYVTMTFFDSPRILHSAGRGFETTSELDHQEFGELNAGLVDHLETSGADPDGDGLYDLLRVKVPVTLRAEGSFALQARLHQGGKTLAYKGAKLRAPQGLLHHELQLGGPKLAASGLEGPYTVTVSLYDERSASHGDVEIEVPDLKASSFE